MRCAVAKVMRDVGPVHIAWGSRSDAKCRLCVLLIAQIRICACVRVESWVLLPEWCALLLEQINSTMSDADVSRYRHCVSAAVLCECCSAV